MPMACANQLLEKLESTRELPTIPAVLVPLLRSMERPGQPNETRARQYVFNPRADQGCEPHVEVRFCTSPRPAEARAISEAGVRRARTAATYSRCFSASPFAAISVPREYLQGTSGSTGNRGARNFHRRTAGAAGYLAAVTGESARRNARGATHAARFHRPICRALGPHHKAAGRASRGRRISWRLRRFRPIARGSPLRTRVRRLLANQALIFDHKNCPTTLT